MTTLYCTVQDVRNALTPGGVKSDSTTYDRTGKTAASFEDWQLEDAIIEAQTLIDMHVLWRYKIENADVEEPKMEPDGTGPIDPPETITVNVAPEPIRRWTRSLAAWFATLTDRQGKDLEERDPVELRRLQVMAALAAVASGNLVLQLPLSDNLNEGGGIIVVNIYEGDLFTPEDFGLVIESSGRQVTVPARYPWW